jgi:multidrug efflux system membrane fusion protein
MQSTDAIPSVPELAPGAAVASARRRPWGVVVGWLLGILAIGGVITWAVLGGGPAPAPAGGGRRGGDGRAAPVGVVRATRGDVPVYLDGLGSVTPLATVAVKSRVDGQLMRLHFEEGQVVEAGALLAEIDPRPFEVQLAQAEGQKARDEALLRNARVDLDRYKTLFEQDSIAKQQLDGQESLVLQYEAAVKSDQSQVDNAKLQLEYARIRAPIGGRVGLRQVDAGNMVRTGDPAGLVVITQMQPITVVFTIPQDDLPAVLARSRRGEAVPVEAWDRAQAVKLATGQLASIDNQIDPTTGMIRLKAQFANRDEMLFPSQFVNVRMLVDTKKGVVVVPSAAIQIGVQGSFVWVVDDDRKVALRVVKPGPSEGDVVAVETGLEGGEAIVVEGVDRLREGSTVVTSERGGGPASRPARGSRPQGGTGSGPASGASGGGRRRGRNG